jgi:hypothetical protein
MTIKRTRASLLKNVVAGDIVHASGARDRTFVCLVEGYVRGKIRARVVTTQSTIYFDGDGNATRPRCRIDSVEPLPPTFLSALLDLDRKMRLAAEAALGKDDIWVLYKLDAFYSSYLIGERNADAN